MEDKADILNGQPVNYAVCQAVATILRNQFKNKRIRLVGKTVTPVSKPTIQLHVDFQFTHAFVTACDGKRVLMADSDLETVIDYTSNAYKQIKESYEVILQDPLNHIQFLKVNQQAEDDYSCVTYSAANLVELLTPGGNPECKYVNKLLRPHLIHCLENKKFTPFPKKRKRPSPRPPKPTKA